MNKYIYSECQQDSWPEIKTLVASSYISAEEKLINKFGDYFEDDEIYKFDTLNDLRDYLNEKYICVISDLIDIEEL